MTLHRRSIFPFIPVQALIVVAAAYGLSYSFDLSYPHYNKLLHACVCDSGISYGSITEPAIDSAMADFSSLPREIFDSLPQNTRIAFLLNIYNCYTLALIKRNLPGIAGIRDIGRPWDRRFVSLFGDKVSLDNIEQNMLRNAFAEPRIHFALVCASKSCPRLASSAYTGDSLNAQLTRQAKDFLTTAFKNRMSRDTAYLSQIFQWYGKDFEKPYGGYVHYIASVLGTKPRPFVRFIPYDWSLNKAEPCR